MQQQRRRDVGGIFIGAIIVAVGIYYMLQKTFGFNIPDLNWDQLWPLAVIALGVAILYSQFERRGHGPQNP